VFVSAFGYVYFASTRELDLLTLKQSRSCVRFVGSCELVRLTLHRIRMMILDYCYNAYIVSYLVMMRVYVTIDLSCMKIAATVRIKNSALRCYCDIV